MSSIELPEPISTYFRSKNSETPDEVLNCFSPNAVVVDTGEGAELTGTDEIRKWLSGTVAAYKLSTEVIRHVKQDEAHVVTALVSGQFPGSPIEFDYHFEVQDGKIDRLTIH